MKHLLLLFVFPLIVCAQNNDNSNRITLDHIGFSLGSGIVEDSENTVFGGLEIGLRKNKHLLKAYILSGGPTRTFWDTEPYGNFAEINLLYGREYTILPWLILDAHGGVGYVSFGEKNPDGSRYTVSKNSIGFPVEGTISIPVWKWLRLGFRAHHNFNAFRNVTTLGGMLSYQF